AGHGARQTNEAFLFSPAAAYRMHYVAQSGDPDRPEYPPPGAPIDYYLASVSSGDVKLEILDSAGHVGRTVSSHVYHVGGGRGGWREGQAPAPRGRRGGAGATTLPKKPGMNRFIWDLRYAGPWQANAADGSSGGGAGEGFGRALGGPLAAPGTYTARLTVGAVTQTQSFAVKIDPRVVKDGVKPADLVTQLEFSLKVRDGLSEANRLADRLKKALDAKSGDQAALRRLYDQLVNKPGPYTENMLIAQFQNLAREVGQADQV